MAKQTFILTLGPDVELTVLADDSHRHWNGFAVPILTADQAAIVGAAINAPGLAAGDSAGLHWHCAGLHRLRYAPTAH